MRFAIIPYSGLSGYFISLADQTATLLSETSEPCHETITVRELGPEDHLVLHASSKAFLVNRRGTRCRVSMLLVEPTAIQRRFYSLIRGVGGRYHRVLTHNSRLLQQVSNAIFVPHGGTFLRRPFPENLEKDRLVSIIASRKKSTKGQALRHRVIEWAKQAGHPLGVYGYGYQPLEDKAVGHGRYMFSVVIENSREPGYFSEKLIDALLCESLPIYWGAPDIAHFFDPAGMIICRNESDIRRAISQASEGEYDHRLPVLQENRRRALRYLNCLDWIPLALRSEEFVRPAISQVPPFE